MLKSQSDTNTPRHSFLFVGFVFWRFNSLNWLIKISDKTRGSSRKQRENMARDNQRRRNRRGELPVIVTISHETGFPFLSDHTLPLAAQD